MTTDFFNFDELDEMEKMFQEFGLGSLETDETEYDEFDPNNQKKRDEFDLDLDGLEELDSLISPDSSLEEIFNVFDQYVADRPYLSEQDEGNGDNDFFDGGGGDNDD